MCLTSCQVSKEKFAQHVADKQNGPWTSSEGASFVYSLQYRPVAFQAMLQSEDNEELADLLEATKGIEYYYLSIQAKEQGFTFPAPGTESRRVLETTYGFEALRLETAKGLIAPIEYYYEPSYNLRPEVGLLFAFNTGDVSSQDGDRIVHVKGPFDAQERVLRIEKTKIEDIPNFKL